MPSARTYPVIPVFLFLLGAGCGDTDPDVEPAGRETTTRTEFLKAGAALLQNSAPVNAMNVYVVGFHPAKDNPDHQMEAHHICTQVNEDFAQCVLFDGNTRDANLNGIEYIISERLFETLPEDERQYWHPHNYEILSGQLVAPGIPAFAEMELMKSKINSYGKTWHVWNTGSHDEEGDALPFGEPVLGWSLNRDGEALPGLEAARDERMGISTGEKRSERRDLVEFANPQSGVDALHGRFERPTESMPGVSERVDQ